MGGGTPPARRAGVHILAFGKRGYLMAACNLAASIRNFSPSASITIHIGIDLKSELREEDEAMFSRVNILSRHFTHPSGVLDPGWVKANVYRLLPDGPSLVLDADTLCIKDIGPLLDELASDGRPFITEVIGKGDAPEYFDWITPKQAREKDAEGPLYGLNTSWMFFRKPDADEIATAAAQELTMWQVSELKGRWGGCLPDELGYSLACTRLGYDPSRERNVMFFGSKLSHNGLSDLQGDFYFMSYYGQGIGRPRIKVRYLELYDRLLRNIYSQWERPFNYPIRHVLRDKWVNATPR